MRRGVGTAPQDEASRSKFFFPARKAHIGKRNQRKRTAGTHTIHGCQPQILFAAAFYNTKNNVTKLLIKLWNNVTIAPPY